MLRWCVSAAPRSPRCRSRRLWSASTWSRRTRSREHYGISPHTDHATLLGASITMPLTVTMPQLGESVTEGTIARWLKQPGEHVARYESIAEVITDKVNAEIPAPADGTMAELIAPEGAVVAVGQPICSIETEASAATTQAQQAQPQEAQAQEAQPEPSAPASPQPVQQETPAPASPPSMPPAQVQQPAPAGAPSAAPPVGSTPAAPAFAAGAGDTVVPLTSARRAIAEHMVRSRHTSPHAYVLVEVDMSAVSR